MAQYPATGDGLEEEKTHEKLTLASRATCMLLLNMYSYMLTEEYIQWKLWYVDLKAE